MNILFLQYVHLITANFSLGLSYMLKKVCSVLYFRGVFEDFYILYNGTGPCTQR